MFKLQTFLSKRCSVNEVDRWNTLTSQRSEHQRKTECRRLDWRETEVNKQKISFSKTFHAFSLTPKTENMRKLNCFIDLSLKNLHFEFHGLSFNYIYCVIYFFDSRKIESTKFQFGLALKFAHTIFKLSFDKQHNCWFFLSFTFLAWKESYQNLSLLRLCFVSRMESFKFVWTAAEWFWTRHKAKTKCEKKYVIKYFRHGLIISGLKIGKFSRGKLYALVRSFCIFQT